MASVAGPPAIPWRASTGIPAADRARRSTVHFVPSPTRRTAARRRRGADGLRQSAPCRRTRGDVKAGRPRDGPGPPPRHEQVSPILAPPCGTNDSIVADALAGAAPQRTRMRSCDGCALGVHREVAQAPPPARSARPAGPVARVASLKTGTRRSPRPAFLNAQEAGWRSRPSVARGCPLDLHD